MGAAGAGIIGATDWMTDSAPTTNWPDVAKAALWPALVLLTVLIFIEPLFRFVSHVGTNVGPAQDIELGPVKFHFSLAAAQALPAPSDAVAAAISHLDPPAMQTLLRHTAEATWNTCAADGITQDASADERDYSMSYDTLLRLQLVTETPYDHGMPVHACRTGDYKSARLTATGKAARSYLFDVLTKTLSFSHS